MFGIVRQPRVSLCMTDPLDADTDDDGFDDGVEVLAGTNPLDENDFPTPPVPALPVWALALLAILLGGTARAAHLGQRTFDA